MVISIYLRRTIYFSHIYKSVRFISVFDGPNTVSSGSLDVSSRKFPTVSTVISKTMPVENLMILRKWQEKMRKQMGEQEFSEYVAREWKFPIQNSF